MAALKFAYYILHHFTCTSSHLIYGISRNRCVMLYTGETGRSLKARFGECRRAVTNNDTNQSVTRHSNNGSHCDRPYVHVVPSKCRENDFRSACLTTEIFLRELTLSSTLDSNPKSSHYVDPQFSHKLLFYLYEFHDNFFHCSTTRMDEDTRSHNSK